MTGKGPPAVIRISPKSLVSADGAPSTDRTGPYNPEEEDSVTTRGLAVGYRDDSVTARSPNVGGISGKLPPAIDGETEGTTKRVTKKKQSPSAPDDEAESEADARDDSVTAAAPGHLTNMLRVIASPTDESGEEGEFDEDPLQAHTQVMANAPVKPPGHASPRGGQTPASQREPTSESGLRVAGQENLGGDRASLGALGVPGSRERRHSGPIRPPYTSDAALGPSPSDGLSRSPFAPMPNTVAPDDRKPPYALLVAVVALVSIAIPVLLFVILSQGGPDAPPRVTAQPSPDPVGLTGPRPKAKPASSATKDPRNPRR
jgi:hypothetical protein